MMCVCMSFSESFVKPLVQPLVKPLVDGSHLLVVNEPGKGGGRDGVWRRTREVDQLPRAVLFSPSRHLRPSVRQFW